MPKTHARIFDGIKMDWLSTLFATVLGFVRRWRCFGVPNLVLA